MTTSAAPIEHWQQRLTELAAKHHVVGASLAILAGEDTIKVATGVLNTRTATAATTESVFQYGSITKVFTTTLAMQLVDEGLLDLDVPITAYLPEFRVDDEALTAGLTTRHLMSHSSGLVGDFFPDTGRGEDNLERFVTLMSELTATHPLGATMSYCNAGFTLLGRVIEVLRGKSWDEVLQERLLLPLGMDAAGTLPEQALLWGAAVGHITPPGAAEPMLTPQWGLMRNAGPAGTLHGRAADLLAFAQLHLNDGLAPDGTRLLTSESAQAMRVPQVEVPDRWTLGSHWGLGWILIDWDGAKVFGHDGATLGQQAFLRVLPGSGERAPLAVALTCNGGDMGSLYHAIFAEVFSEYAGVTMTPPLEPTGYQPEVDLGTYVGTYSRESMEYVIEPDGEGLRLVARPSGVLATALGATEMTGPMIPFERDVFLTTLPALPGFIPAVFYTIATGESFLHLGGRATPRT